MEPAPAGACMRLVRMHSLTAETLPLLPQKQVLNVTDMPDTANAGRQIISCEKNISRVQSGTEMKTAGAHPDPYPPSYAEDNFREAFVWLTSVAK